MQLLLFLSRFTASMQVSCRLWSMTKQKACTKPAVVHVFFTFD